MSVDLSRLDAEEFADELRESLFDEDMWAAFVDDEVVDRTRAALTSLAGELESQVQAHTEEWGREWATRAKNLLRRVRSRITETNAAIRERNKRQSATVEATSRKWSTFALELAQALSASDMAFVLDEITVGDISARVWLEKREAIATAKENRRAAA